MKKPVARDRDRDLSWFTEERQVPADSHMWKLISTWQRDGLVKLRWPESRGFCYVQTTPKGTEAGGMK